MAMTNIYKTNPSTIWEESSMPCYFLVSTTSLICTLREDSPDDTLCSISLLILGEYI